MRPQAPPHRQASQSHRSPAQLPTAAPPLNQHRDEPPFTNKASDPGEGGGICGGAGLQGAVALIKRRDGGARLRTASIRAGLPCHVACPANTKSAERRRRLRPTLVALKGLAKKKKKENPTATSLIYPGQPLPHLFRAFCACPSW